MCWLPHCLRLLVSISKVKAARLERLLAVLCDAEKDVAALLKGLSCAAHMQLVLFRQHKTKLMTGQLYHDTQATIKAIFFCVTRFEKHCPAEPFLGFQVSTDGLENQFAVSRTLTHSSNFDMKEFGDRLGAAMSLEEIYERHPEWSRISKRLNGSLDHMNVRSWLDGGPDGTAPGNCDVRHANVAEAWNDGRRESIEIFQQHRDFKHVDQAVFDDLENQGVTMFCPFG